LRHGFGIAEIAHGLVLCFGERENQMLALLSRSLGAKEAGSGLIRSPYPKGCKQRGRIHPRKICIRTGTLSM
jgi:hypothetical protein